MKDIEVLAYFFPNYHLDARNEAWHGKGWTEWDLVRAARPRYPGHQQPKVPAWGYHDESDPAWAEKEIDLAADHGVTGFIYDWYWYGDSPYLNGALERGFLHARNRKRLSFSLMWANHDWMDIQPAKFVNKPVMLERGSTSPESFDRLTDYVVSKYFSQPEYLKIDGCPYFSIYELGTLLKGLGGLDGTRAAIARFRDKTRAAGFPDLHLNVVVWGFAILPTEVSLPNRDEIIARIGFASATTYAWAHHYPWDQVRANFPHGSYELGIEANRRAISDYAGSLPIPYHPNVSMGWDPSPRTVQTDRYEDRGYPFTAIYEGNTPERFKAALLDARKHLEGVSYRPMVVTLNAWNEWTEGSYLLPDEVHGTAYLQAVREVFPPR